MSLRALLRRLFVWSIEATIILASARACSDCGMGNRRANDFTAGIVGRWFGILIFGLIICLAAVRGELAADSPAMSVALLRRQYEQTFESTTQERLARWAERVERNRLLYIARTIGIATILIGPNMFILHQL